MEGKVETRGTTRSPRLNNRMRTTSYLEK